MGRVRPRSNVYAVLPILACLIMAVGIGFTWVRVQEYTGPEPKPTVQYEKPLPDRMKPDEPTVEAPADEPPAKKEGEGEGVAPADDDVAPADDDAAPADDDAAPAKGGEKKKEEDPEAER